MRYSFPQPGNEDEFEEFCVRFYRLWLKRDGLIRYGKRGEKQDGIDIIDQANQKPLVAIQCKQHEQGKRISKKDIQDEVALAEASLHPIERYIIATTARKSRTAQDTVVELNGREDASRRFEVLIHFWEDICAWLGEFERAVLDYVLYGERHDQQSLASITWGPGTRSAATADSETGDEGTELYPEIDVLFKNRKLEAAEHEINKLPDPEQDSTLSKQRRYAILRLRAKLALERLHYDEAARLFMLAYHTSPELQQARQNRVLSLELAGAHEEAFREAAALVKQGLRAFFLVALLIRNASVPADLLPFQETIDEYASSNEEVSLSLAYQYLTWDQSALAQNAARNALAIAPKSAHALFSSGMVAHRSAVEGDWQERCQRLTEALHHYSEALTAAEQGNYAGLLPELLSNRARVRSLLGDLPGAAQDYRAAVNVAVDSHLYAEAAVSFFLHSEDYASAQELMSKLDASSDEAAFLIAVIQYHYTPHDQKKARIIALASLADRDFDRAIEARFFCVQWALELKDVALAHQCLPERFVKRQPFHGNTLLASIELAAGNTEPARAAALLALDSSSRAANPQEISFLASVLTRLGEDEKALPLLDQAATPGVLDCECRRLMACAQRLERHDTLLRICAELRQTNQQDEATRKLEVQLLSHYAPERAFVLAREYASCGDPYFAAATNFIAVRLGRRDEIRCDYPRLPNPDDFEPAEAYLVVTPYIELGRFRDAIEFAYHQVRTHFSEELAHGQYVWLMSSYGEKAGVPHYLEVVDEESAVCLESTAAGEKRWLIIEDRRPDLARNEYSRSTPFVQSLIGKRVDDTVTLSGPSAQPHSERIIGIHSKYVRLFQDVIGNFQRRFPGAGTIQMIHCGDGDHFDPSALIENLRARRQYAENALAFYHNNPCSLYLLASRLGINERQLIACLAADNEWCVRCVECSVGQFTEATQAECGKKKVVLDISAIVTIAMLDAWEHLDEQWEFLISQATSSQIAEWQNEANAGSQPTAISHLSEDGKVVVQEVTQEHLQKERTELQAIVNRIGSLCTVRSSIALAKLDPRSRKQYLDVCGAASLEAMSVARDESALLWTDDLVVGVIAELDFGVGRMWTQLAFKILADRKRIGADAYNEITTKLAAWNYVATVWEPEHVITAGRLCDWDVERWPLKQSIQLIRTCRRPPHERGRIAIEVLRLLRKSDCSEFRQSPTIQAVLTAVGNRATVKQMLRDLDAVFRFDLDSAEFLKPELIYWLQTRFA